MIGPLSGEFDVESWLMTQDKFVIFLRMKHVRGSSLLDMIHIHTFDVILPSIIFKRLCDERID